MSIDTYLTYLIRRKYPVHVCYPCFHQSKLHVLIINPDLVYDYYIPRYELVGWEISGARLEIESPSVIEEDSTAFELSASSSQRIQQPSLTNNDTQVSSTFWRTPTASSLLASPEAHHIDGEQSDSRIASLNHQIASSPQMGLSTGANLGETEPLLEMYSSTAPIVSGPYSTSNSEDWRSYFSDIFDVEHQPTGSSHTSWDCHRPDSQFTVPDCLSISWNTLMPFANRDLQPQRRVDTNERAVDALPVERLYSDFSECLEVLSSPKPPDEATHGHQDISLPIVTSDEDGLVDDDAVRSAKAKPSVRRRFLKCLEVLSSPKPPDEATHGHQDISLPIVTSDEDGLVDGTVRPAKVKPSVRRRFLKYL